MTVQIFTEHEINILEKDFNYALTSKNIPKEDILSSIENSFYKLQDHEKEIIKQESCKILREATAPKPNLCKAEKLAAKQLNDIKDILILRADKGNATVIMKTNEFEEKKLTKLSKKVRTKLSKRTQ